MIHEWFYQQTQALDEEAKEGAITHQSRLTKPPGALGELENIAINFAAWQGKVKPTIERVAVRVFAADHGIAKQGVSAFPQEVTVQMVANFVAGGAAISVLARDLGADFSVVNMGAANPLLSSEGVIDLAVGPGTKDFSEQAAMTLDECFQALAAGRDVVDELDCDIFIGGEMGIANTTSASAIYSVLLNIPPAKSIGPGTGVDNQGLIRKHEVLTKSLALHHDKLDSPLSILQHLGGFEIAGLAGAYIRCAQRGIPILVDGFICTAAALLAVKLNGGVNEWLIFSHKSAEPAHIEALAYFNVKALLDLSMRLGEGSGAAVALPLIRSALSLHASMATFDQAGVSDKSA